MPKWNLTIPDETDRLVRTHLARNGMKKGDLSALVNPGGYLFVGLYHHDESERGKVAFFDVMETPPFSGRPKLLLDWSQFIDRIGATYDARNNPPFRWAE